MSEHSAVQAGMETITVIVVDDDITTVRKPWVAALDGCDGIEVVGQAGHAQAGLAAALETEPDVVLMDIHMPGMDAFWACEQIVQKTKGETRVLFFTGFPRDSYLDRCLAAGGIGMCSKHTETLENMCVAIRHVSRGEKYFSSELAKRLVEPEVDKPQSRLSTLQAREVEVLRKLSSGRTNRQISDELEIGLRSVEKAVSDLKRKLALKTTNELLIFAANEGILHPELSVHAQEPDRVENLPHAGERKY